MYSRISEYYNKYYRYDLPEEQKPGDVVNSLFERVERNDQEALEEVLKILASNTFYLVRKWLLNYNKNVSLEDVDDVLQNARMEIIQTSFRGFPKRVTKEIFYGYLIVLTKNCIFNYRRGLKVKNENEQFDTEDSSSFEILESAGNKNRSVNPEDVFVSAETEKEILHFYLEALRGTEEKPYRVLSYCYAVLIPQLFKKSSNPDFLRKVDIISSRNAKPPFSHYNEEKNCLEGEITRKSAVLMNWALDAMEGRKAEELDKEFLELYEEEPLNEEPFAWERPYLINMEKTEHNMPVKHLVITKEFKQKAIKNWPVRMAESLRDEAGRLAQKDRAFCKKSVRIVEDMICR